MPTILLTTFIPLEIYDRSYDPVKRYHVLTLPVHALTGSLLYLKNLLNMNDFLFQIHVRTSAENVLAKLNVLVIVILMTILDLSIPPLNMNNIHWPN